jgi:FKBP-type peptidyl-prolyl cis-trans isomerase FkpA
MAKKVTLREQRRQARAAQKRKQQEIGFIVAAVAIVLLAFVALLGWNRQRNINASITATTVAQMATNTVLAATQVLQQTVSSQAQATTNALSSSVKAMKFPGVPTDTVKTSSGLEIKDNTAGSGREAKAGDTVLVHYTGWLEDGTQFDSSVGKQPFSVKIGQGNVIKGWDEGLAGMKVGGDRILVVPPELGYGAEGSPPTIPANAKLVFEIVLLSIQ